MNLAAARRIYSLVLAAAFLAIAGCDRGTGKTPGAAGTSDAAAAQPRRLILLTNGNSPFWDACRFGLQKGAEDLKLSAAGFRAVMEVNDGTPQGQIDKLRQFGSQSDIAAVAVSALDANNVAVAELMRDLRKKGIHVICIDADVNRETMRDAREFYIGTDNISGGRALGITARELLKSRGHDTGEYVQFVGRTGSQNAIERMNGFKEAVGKSYVEKDRMADDLDRTRARDNVRNAIRNHPGLNCLVGIWSYNAPAIVDVVTQENKRKDFTIVTFDAEPIAIKQFGEGKIDAMVVQNPFKMGYEGVTLMRALVQNDQAAVKKMFPKAGQADGDLYDTGLKVVVPAETPLKKEMFSDKTEFLTLPQFKAWLDQYGLMGS